MILRSATDHDAPDIAALERALFGVDAWPPTVVTDELSGYDRQAVVAVTHDHLIGYAMTMRSGDVMDLQRVGVRKAHQRTGIGRALLEVLRGRAAEDGAMRMMLEVSAANASAVAFYAAVGFVEIDRRRGYYRDGTDALVLDRPLGRAASGGGGLGP